MSSPRPAGGSARMARYASALERAGADALVLTSEPALQHAAGIRLYSQRLIPQRPVACVIAPPARPVCVCVEYEVDQLRLEAPDLDVRAFGELTGDPWNLVARALEELDARHAIVEDTILAPWLAALELRFAGGIEVSYEVPVEARIMKDPEEIDLLGEASRGAESALAAGAALLEPGRSEADIGREIVRAFTEHFGDRAGEVTGICTAPQNNRAMHHRAGPTAMPSRGPVRVGVVGRLDGYWVLLTRMVVLGKDEIFTDAYERYAACYEENLSRLRPGERCSDLYGAARARLAAAGLQLTSEKIGHGTGVDFREAPWISATNDDELPAGSVLAFDYGADADRLMLHVEDRVLVDAEGPRRLSDGWDLSDAKEGFRALL